MTTPPAIPRPSVPIPNSAPEITTVPPPSDGYSTQSASASSTATLTSGRTLKPIGIINEQNTCFLNSTFQAISATAPLISLLNSSPDGPFIPSPLNLLPPPAVDAKRIPSLLPDALEPPLYQLLPVTRTFLTSLQKSWKMKDGGGGTSGSGETSSSRSMRLNHLLREMARKYDQYDDYMQQDAHELLRHLLDSMEMEEKDIIKRVQPQPPARKSRNRNRNRDMISPLASPLHSPTPSAPASPTRVTFLDPMTTAMQDRGRSEPNSPLGGFPEPAEISEDERMVPFVDVLFGGLLASVVVCEHCKSVSHTYEGFLDISLSLKGDLPRQRKRDRLKAAFGLKPRGSVSKQSGSEHPSNNSAHTHSGAISESELSDSERRPSKDQDRRKSMDHDARPPDHELSDLKRNGSMSVFGIKGGFSFGKKKQQPKHANSTSSNHSHSSQTSHTSHVDPDRTPPAANILGSPNTSTRHHGPGPSPAQAAYIQRILSGPHMSATHDDPLAKLRAANSGEGGVAIPVEPESTGLEESLKHFTSVEVLEGDNAFACRKCWKIKSGKYKNGHGHPTVHEHDEAIEGLISPTLSSTKVLPPAISIVGSETGSERGGSFSEDSQRIGRTSSIASRSSAASQQRAPSPLRRLVEVGNEQSALDTSSAASAVSTESGLVAEPEGDVSDGLSDSDTSDDEPPPSTLPAGHRPKMPKRRQSSHFVMRRAFKRYLIAKAPEVLVFHFKRFKQTQKSGLMTSFYDLKKMEDFVSFPEILDLAPYLAPNRNDYKLHPTAHGPRAPYMDWASPEHGPETQEPVYYRLYALVVHLGSMVGGHYIAYVLVDPEVMFNTHAVPSGVSGEITDGVDGLSLEQQLDESRPTNETASTHSSRPSLPGPDRVKKDRRVWCYCSDTSIRLASLEEVLAAKAYICFYEKVYV